MSVAGNGRSRALIAVLNAVRCGIDEFDCVSNRSSAFGEHNFIVSLIVNDETVPYFLKDLHRYRCRFLCVCSALRMHDSQYSGGGAEAGHKYAAVPLLPSTCTSINTNLAIS